VVSALLTIIPAGLLITIMLASSKRIVGVKFIYFLFLKNSIFVKMPKYTDPTTKVKIGSMT
jgi:hypothetical protein